MRIRQFLCLGFPASVVMGRRDELATILDCGNGVCNYDEEESCADLIAKNDFIGTCCSLTDNQAGGCTVSVSDGICHWKPSEDQIRIQGVFLRSSSLTDCPTSEYDPFATVFSERDNDYLKRGDGDGDGDFLHADIDSNYVGREDDDRIETNLANAKGDKSQPQSNYEISVQFWMIAGAVLGASFMVCVILIQKKSKTIRTNLSHRSIELEDDLNSSFCSDISIHLDWEKGKQYFVI